MTGLTSDQVDGLVLDVYATDSLDPARRGVLGPYRSVLVMLLYLRHNLIKRERPVDRSLPTKRSETSLRRRRRRRLTGRPKSSAFRRLHNRGPGES
jgi:hypothetical protein